jgi:hypothetical protein
MLFYPPLFAVVEAAFFAIFGVSKATALLTVAVFYLAAAWACTQAMVGSQGSIRGKPAFCGCTRGRTVGAANNAGNSSVRLLDMERRGVVPVS